MQKPWACKTIAINIGPGKGKLCSDSGGEVFIDVSMCEDIVAEVKKITRYGGETLMLHGSRTWIYANATSIAHGVIVASVIVASVIVASVIVASVIVVSLSTDVYDLALSLVLSTGIIVVFAVRLSRTGHTRLVCRQCFWCRRRYTSTISYHIEAEAILTWANKI
jgi:hypothetical protein